jgi:CRP-like cAMP-binding protein
MEKILLIKMLKSTNPFKYLDEKAVLFIIEYGQLVHFDENQTILTQGKMGQGLYIVIEGNLNVTIKLLGKGEIHLATLVPGNFFGEVSLLENEPCTATISTKEKTLCFLFKKKSFDCLYLAFPEIRHHIAQALIEEVIIRQRLIITAIKKHTKDFLQYKITLNLYPDNVGNSILHEVKKNELIDFLKNFHLNGLTTIHPNPYIINKIEFPNNYIVIQQKQSFQSCFYILRGAVKVGIMTASGFLKFAVIGPQHLICPTSMLDNKPELFVYKAIGTTTLIEIPSLNMNQMKQKDSLMWYQFYDILIGHIISLQKKLNAQILLMESGQPEKSHV